MSIICTIIVAVAVAEYTVAVAVAEYAVWYTGLCCVICRTIQEYKQDYVIWYTRLHYMVYNTSCYVM